MSTSFKVVYLSYTVATKHNKPVIYGLTTQLNNYNVPNTFASACGLFIPPWHTLRGSHLLGFCPYISPDFLKVLSHMYVPPIYYHYLLVLLALRFTDVSFYR